MPPCRLLLLHRFCSTLDAGQCKGESTDRLVLDIVVICITVFVLCAFGEGVPPLYGRLLNVFVIIIRRFDVAIVMPGCKLLSYIGRSKLPGLCSLSRESGLMEVTPSAWDTAMPPRHRRKKKHPCSFSSWMPCGRYVCRCHYITYPYNYSAHNASRLAMQITQQFPLSFEFNERFLHTLFVHSYSSMHGESATLKDDSYHCQFCSNFLCLGNFLYDTPKERTRNRLSEKTTSLWLVYWSFGLYFSYAVPFSLSLSLSLSLSPPYLSPPQHTHMMLTGHTY